ncbi:MAG: helix-turn-helix transcriptional regulator [Bacteroidaceae bacterium]|nr:helix-turn-helix transcriptional regulator [Bacteroidaceae bacterium]
MELKERIDAVLASTGLSAAAFAKRLGVKTTQTIYDLTSGKTRTLSSDVLTKIASCFPQFSVEWLMTGEGEMFRPSISQKVEGCENMFSTTGNVSGIPADIYRQALDEIAAQRRLVEKRDEQIDRLLTIIETRNTDK